MSLHPDHRVDGFERVPGGVRTHGHTVLAEEHTVAFRATSDGAYVEIDGGFTKVPLEAARLLLEALRVAIDAAEAARAAHAETGAPRGGDWMGA